MFIVLSSILHFTCREKISIIISIINFELGKYLSHTLILLNITSFLIMATKGIKKIKDKTIIQLVFYE